MARLTDDQWASVRAEREATGASYRDLGEKYGVSDVTVMNRAKKEGWSDGKDVAEIIRRKAQEKVSGIVSGGDPKRRAEAIDAAASCVAAVVEQHQAEWNEHRSRFGSIPSALIALPDDAKAEQRVAVIRADFEAAKLAKISAEMLKIRQEGERKAYGLESANPPGNDKPTAVTVYLPSNER